MPLRRPDLAPHRRGCAARLAVPLAVLCACGPSVADDESTAGTTAAGASDDTSTPTSTSTGDPLCALAVGADEPMEADPHGCYKFTDEAGCEAKRELGECTVLRGQRVGCNDAGLCMEDVAEFIGCRPFELCKMAHYLVCRAGPGGEIEAFYTPGCVPNGFSLCDPQPAEFADGHALRHCL